MTKYTQQITAEIKSLWIKYYWKQPNNLWALKVSITLALLVIPCIYLKEYFIATTLGLGVVGTALAETTGHPKAILKASLITLGGVFASCCIIELLHNIPLAFAIWLPVFSFLVILTGGISATCQGISLGIMLISIYCMMGLGTEPNWYYQPIFLPLGGLAYTLLSVAIMSWRPWRIVEEQLAVGFTRVAAYTSLKSKFFPSTKNNQDKLRNQLAQLNAKVVEQISACKNTLASYQKVATPAQKKQLKKCSQLWMLLQEIHERVASSHEEYDILSEDENHAALIEGFGQVLHETGRAIKKYGESLLTNTPYQHLVSLKWAVAAQNNLLNKYRGTSRYMSFSLLMKNLSDLEYMVT